MYFHASYSVLNPMFVDHMTVDVFNDTNGVSKLNMTVSQIVDLPKAVSFFVLSVKNHPKDKDFKKEVLRSSADHCKLANGIFGNFIVKKIVELLEETSNFTYTCPQRKGFYHVTNFAVLDLSLPVYMVGLAGDFELVVTVKAKVSKSKTLAHVFTVRVIGALYIGSILKTPKQFINSSLSVFGKRS